MKRSLFALTTIQVLSAQAPGNDTQRLERLAAPLPSTALQGPVSGLAKVALSGRVVSPDGRPIPRATVEIYPLVSLSFLAQSSTNAKGEFKAMVPERACLVIAKAPGFMPKGRIVMTPTDPKTSGFDITLTPGGFPLNGRAVGPQGNPLPHGEVWVQDFGTMDDSCVYRTELAAGRFSMNLPKGEYRVTIRCQGFAEAREMCVIDGATEREFTVRSLPKAPSLEVKSWMRGHAIPLRTMEPSGPYDDLRPLGDIIGESKIVGLGESSHGTHECFTFKHRMIEYLVREKGFSTLLVEEDFGLTSLVDDYVRLGKGDAESAVAGLNVEFWKTEEMVSLVRWMRAYNEDAAHVVKIGFRGIDPRDPCPPYRVAMGGLAAIDPAAAATIRTSGFDDKFVQRVNDELRKVPMEEMAKGLASARALIATITALEGRIGDSDLSKLRLAAIMVGQFFEIHATPIGSDAIRDRLMAENVDRIRQEGGHEGKAILWAHNGHVMYGDFPLGGKTLGDNLRTRFGKDYVTFVTSFNRGSYRAWGQPNSTQQGLMAMDVPSLPSGSFPAAMLASGLTRAAIDLRAVPKDGVVGRWFREPRPEWFLGGGQSVADISYIIGALPVVLPDIADVAVFVDRTTPSRPRPEVMMPYDLKPKSVLPRATNLDFRLGAVGRPPEGWETVACWGFPKVDATSTVLTQPDGTRCVAISPRPVQDPGRITVLAQTVDGTPYRGKTLRMTALVKDDDRTQGNPTYAAMWIRADRPSGIGAYETCPLPEGKHDGWHRIAVTIPVAADATTLVLGFRCGGDGNDHVGLLVRDVTIDVVSP